ncbi:hypothetical protein [Legionella tunisiensis]|uniref:hypothetical protein n=1 Tax=Legionella tunisiensis TaxID=1034944 RepID=UPI0002F5999B|nr:hypothetical protein [Legionella tunisiensis]
MGGRSPVRFCGLDFLGGLMDPYLGLLAAGVYFFGIGFYLLYHFIVVNSSKKIEPL